MNSLERFLKVMEYEPVDRVPNYELGVWPQTAERWFEEGLPRGKFTWDWFVEEAALDLDRREYIPINFGMIPPFEREVLERTDRYEIIRHPNGVVTKALLEGTVGGGRMSMDQYLSFPVQNLADFRKLTERYKPALPERYLFDWEQDISRWRNRDYPLILGQNCAAGGYYWNAREWMGTEGLSYAWYDQPELMHEMMEFYTDYVIETCRPVLEKIDVEYFNLSEDMAMKGGTLLSPATFKEFIFPRLKRLVEFMKSHGVRYVTLDSDGFVDPVIPLLLEAGVDCNWPLERASDMDPAWLRKKYGRNLRLMGGVDKRELAKGKEAILAHLRSLQPVVAEGGFIPTVDHTVPPDVSYDNFMYYIEAKLKLLEGKL